MCTSLTLQTQDFYFGRNLDLEYSFGERVVITPRRYPFRFRMAPALSAHFALIGMAAVAADYPLYADAANEKGLCMAGLYFPGNAWYPEMAEPGKTPISPFELIPWLLGQCATLAEAKTALQGLQLVNIPFSKDMPLAPLHWHIADRTGSLVLECTKEGLNIYENPAGVLTNNPPFPFHMTNLRQYLNLTPLYPVSRFGAQPALTPFGQGFGALGMPGDFSPASRFVKAAFLRSNSVYRAAGAESVSQFFHILDSVAMVPGSVVTAEGKLDVTTYSCCIQAQKGIYYYKTLENNQITAVNLFGEDLEAASLSQFPLIKTQQIAWEN